MFHLTAHHHSFTKKADILVKTCSYNEHRVYTKNNRLLNNMAALPIAGMTVHHLG